MPRRKVDEMRLMATCVFVALLAGVALLRAEQAPPQQQQVPPQFRTGVDLVRLELTVLDKRTRKPIKGLTADDFIVKVGGDVQRIATIAEVTQPAQGVEQVAFAGAAHDVVGNTSPKPRLFVLVMNDAAGLNDPFDRRTGIAIGHRFIDGMSPDDVAAVVFVRDNRNAQDFTSDRTLLKRAVDRFNPMFTVGLVPFSVLNRAQTFLSTLPDYRRAILYVSPQGSGGAFEEPMQNTLRAASGDDGGPDGRALRAIASGAGIGHVPIYLFSTHGLHAPTREDLSSGHLGRHITFFEDQLLVVARMTGGRAVVGHNAPTDVVPDVFEELSSYYVIGYEPTYPQDGRLAWLQVEVRHPDAMVMPTGVPIATAKALGAPEVAKGAPGARVSASLTEALGAPLPSGAVPLRLSSVPLALQTREQALALTLGLPAVVTGEPEQFRLRLFVFDGEGRRQLYTQSQDLTLTSRPGVSHPWSELALRLALRPGRYNLRLVAERLSTSEAGSVHVTVTVPDFAGAPLSLSGVAIGWAEGPAIGGRDVLSDLLPFAPTSVRAFARTDRVGALLRAHQRARGPARPAVVETEIVDASGAVVHTSVRTVAADAFVGGVGVDHQFEVPLSTLAPGDYLLRFVVTVGEHRSQRDVRFAVVQR